MPICNFLTSEKAGAAFALAFSFFGQVVAAAAAEPADIQKALSGRTAFEAGNNYRPWRQFFAPDGNTVYFGNGPSSLGKWEVRGTQFCSLWPPAKEWACYDLEIAPESAPFFSIVWISKDGTREAAALFDGDLTASKMPPNR